MPAFNSWFPTSTYGHDIVNAASFGTITANGSYNASEAAANLAAIQAAIDYAFNNNKQVIQLPTTGVVIWMSAEPLWLDSPDNHPAGVYNTGVDIASNFSLFLRGGGAGNHEGYGTRLRWPTDYSGKCLVVGPGQGMIVQGVTIQVTHSSSSCRAARPSGSIGIAWTGGPSGGTRLQLRDVGIEGHYSLIKTGWNEDALADRLRLENVWATDGYKGLEIGQTQNFLVEVRDSDIGDCIYNIYNPQQFAVNVSGGGFGPHSSFTVFTISNISALSAVTESYEFTADVSSPTSFIADGGYNKFVMVTDSFGSVPLTYVSYSSGTITLRILDSWRKHHFGSLNVTSSTDLEAELQAATTLFCGEVGTNFYGPVHVNGIHCEATRPYVLLDTTGSTATHPSYIRGVKYNGGPAVTEYDSIGAGNATEAAQQIARAHPHINLGTSSTVIEDFNFAESYLSDAILVDTKQQGATDHVFNRINSPQIHVRHWSLVGNDDLEQYPANPFKGFGRFDRSPFLPRASAAIVASLAHSDNAAPMLGFRPVPHATPILTPNQYSIVSGSLSGVGLTTYPPIHGGTIYKVEKEAETATARKFVSSAHVGYSYGQDLVDANVSGTVAWSFKGASNCVYMDAASLSYMFSGLSITLNFAAADHQMIVTGVYPDLGYVTVSKASIGTGTVSISANDGTKTTTYTGTTIKQAAFSWTTAALA